MKKKLLAGLVIGVFVAVLVGVSQAELDSSDDVYYDHNPCDWSEFEEYEINADIKMLRDKALKVMPAAGFSKEQDDLYEESYDCDWGEYESYLNR